MATDLDRLRWRCRRGMKDLDVLLERWLRERCPGATEAERAAFARLLEASDPQLWDWLVRGLPCSDTEMARLCESLRRR